MSPRRARASVDGCFALPNPRDRGSARLMERLGFPALATSSSAAAWTLGRPDYGLEPSAVPDHLREAAGSCARLAGGMARSLPKEAFVEDAHGWAPRARSSM